MANRNLEKTEQTISQLCREQESSSDKLSRERFVVKELDLSDFASVRRFADEVKSEFPVIDILINNAGHGDLTKKEFDRTQDGFERTFQVNHLSHFLLTYLLVDCLLASPNNPRLINVSSWGHSFYPVDLEDIQCERNFSGLRAYSVSKMANILFAKSLARKYRGRINTYSLHPGTVSTGICRHSSFLNKGISLIRPFVKSEREGALTTIYCAVSPEAGDQSGLYYENSKVGKPAETANDVTSQQKLWTLSCEMTNIQGWNHE